MIILLLLFHNLVTHVLSSCKVFDLKGEILSHESQKPHVLGDQLKVVYWTVLGVYDSEQILAQLSKLNGKQYDVIYEQFLGLDESSKRGHFFLNPNSQYMFQLSNNGKDNVYIRYGKLIVSDEQWFDCAINETQELVHEDSIKILLPENVQKFDVVLSNNGYGSDLTIIKNGLDIARINPASSNEVYHYVESFQGFREFYYYVMDVNTNAKTHKFHVSVTMTMGYPSFCCADTIFLSDIELPASKDYPKTLEYVSVPVPENCEHVYWSMSGNHNRLSVIEGGKTIFSRETGEDKLMSDGYFGVSEEIQRGSILKIENTYSKVDNIISSGVLGFYKTSDGEFNRTVSNFRDGVQLSTEERFQVYLIPGTTGVFWTFDFVEEHQQLEIFLEVETKNATMEDGDESYHFKTIYHETLNKKKNAGGGFGKPFIEADRLTILNPTTWDFLLDNEGRNRNQVYVSLDLKVHVKEKEKWYEFILREYWILITAGVSLVVICCIMMFLVLCISTCCLFLQIQKWKDDEKEKQGFIPLL